MISHCTEPGTSYPTDSRGKELMRILENQRQLATRSVVNGQSLHENVLLFKRARM